MAGYNNTRGAEMVGRADAAEAPRLVETGILNDIWVDGIGKIEHLGQGVYRFLLYRKHTPVSGGPLEHEIVASLVTSSNAVVMMIHATQEALALPGSTALMMLPQ
jgi:hypothetical protein